MAAKSKSSYLAGFLVLPAAAVVALAMIVPLGYAVVMSLFDFSPGKETAGVFVGLHYYGAFFQDHVALKSLLVTLIFTVAALGLELAIGIGMAVVLAGLPDRLSRILRAIYSMPLLVSPIIVGLIWRYLYDPTFGLVYQWLKAFGLEHFGGLSRPGTALFCITVADVWQTTPFILLVITSGLTTVPHEVYEAARIDGAGFWRTLFRITLPMIGKVILLVTLIRGTDAFRVFDIIYALTGGGPANSTLSLSIYAFKQGFEQYQMGYAMAISLITMLVLILLFAPLVKRSSYLEQS
ncbi:sugar ABC transporter permease [Paenibacillus sp. ATY16]|uniref:carbohydrate ABC transporter permease n=1 Tax=Paenibacillus sp. ATY16 TaxID=1759312 RepID=UPI00200C30BB|nr:sugar ABC transporter permease [Paenibacillus sp. ATY16]MCK9858645.1 sugar ABC transporter permease [Paenibacillus sp. ATY16]